MAQRHGIVEHHLIQAARQPGRIGNVAIVRQGGDLWLARFARAKQADARLLRVRSAHVGQADQLAERRMVFRTRGRSGIP
ncbi:hypothetical protein [Teichococcus vastitatis]|uniref:Uncharacterized protein n=1 Tax=Teichococcus vastitatis TaxID=2307076 RepID=A0ABS9W6Q3_9PROT|nr:hypothetical protein [Pseudoroseomonas vastitatis]MCI0754901.1 hypothetical protein [Pseudoroseomonas vastitatis]